ncbi:biotin synthase BioB [Aminipila sp.]|uniref:biotin synthase BioB n=1 Tax=Aminipila sp. TaxID=2060095 RepID=UPI00289FA484|nr:biotin synthase BioB [Aminipila sp.]
MINKLKNQIINGHYITTKEALELLSASLLSEEHLHELCEAANAIRRHFCGNKFDLCTIINGKCGRCSEDCKYCAQSSHYPTETEYYPLLEKKEFLDGAKYNEKKGILRYSIVTSGRTLTDEELEELCKCYQCLHENTQISLCASHGLLNYQQFLKLKNAGVVRYHNNLETSRRNFPNICTTHTYEDKISAIQAAQKAGLSICSGGILGLGETREDRISMAFELRGLGIKSIPINILNPIAHTPFEKNEIISEDEVRRTVAVFRFILPDAALRLAGGRGLLADKGQRIFLSGANAAISGDMLTTSGILIDHDMKMLQEIGYEVSQL